jgi:opacity protein-like surface antigen
MKKSFVLFAVFLVLFAVSAEAIDRNARMIDKAQLDLSYLDDADSIGGSIWGEVAVSAPEWAVLAGLGYGTISPDNADNTDYWGISIGLKYYITTLTSVSAVGNYMNLDSGGERDSRSGIVSVKHRLLAPEEPVSPFIQGGIGWRNRSTFSDAGAEDSFSEFLWTAGGGVELSMNDSFSIVFEANFVEADDSPDENEDLDGWVAAAAMRYYFHE